VALDDLDDGALARRVAAAGERVDAQAEGELYRRLARRVRLYGLRHLRDEQAAADLVQQVLLTTLERLRAGEVREPEKIASFVLGMCRMTVLEIRRGSQRREALLEKWGPASAGMTYEAAGMTYGAAGMTYEAPEPLALNPDRLAGCLERLAERERSVVLLTFLADKAAGEVGAELGLSAGNVRVIRHRALARLRECMGPRRMGPRRMGPHRMGPRLRGDDI
jgi:RNA polymerase sigma-70 factor (ECF subfamily)